MHRLEGLESVSWSATVFQRCQQAVLNEALSRCGTQRKNPGHEFKETIVRTSGLFAGILVPRRSRISSAVALWILCMVVPALAHGQESRSSLPDAPSPTAPAEKSQNIDHALTFGERARIYKRSLFNPEIILGPAFSAGINQATNQPSGFGHGAEGYGSRFGSGFGRDVIARTIGFGVAAVDGEDPRYFRSDSRSIRVRIRHAIVSNFVSPTASGRRIPAFSHFAGSYGAAFISNAWYPGNESSAADAARRGSISLGASVAVNLLREFVPHFNRIAPK